MGDMTINPKYSSKNELAGAKLNNTKKNVMKHNMKFILMRLRIYKK